MKVASTVLCGFLLMGSRLVGAQEGTVTGTGSEMAGPLSEENQQPV